MLGWRLVFCLLAVVSSAVRAQETVPHLTIAGTTLVDPHGEPIRLRGFDVEWWTPVTDQDAADIQQLGANCVRYMFGYNPRGTYDPSQIAEVEWQIHYFTSRGIWVVPVLYLFEKPDPADPHKKLGPWSNPEMNGEFLALWTDLMTRLKNEPYLAAWEPLNEPHDAPAATVAAWYRALLPRLRKLDPVRPIVVGGADYSHAKDLTDEFKMDDPNIIYTFHLYDPYEFTTDLRKPPLVYPGKWGKSYLESIVEPAKRFRDRYHVPVWCGEWGTKTGAPGYDRWLRDVHSILEADRFDWCIWAWALQPKDPRNDTFDINRQKTGVYQVVANFFPHG